MKRIAAFFSSALFCTIGFLPMSALAASSSQEEILNILKNEATKTFGGQRANLHQNNALIKEALFLFLGISKDPRNMDDGNAFMDGCRLHSCVEKSAVITDIKNKHLLSVSLLHFNCRLAILNQDDLTLIAKTKRPSSRTQCDDEATLETFLIRRNPRSNPPQDENRLIEEMRTWGRKAGYARENVRILEVQ